MVLIYFFVLNLNPISAGLKSLALFVNSRSILRSILRLIIIFQQMKLVFKAHLPTQQDSRPLITLSGFRIRKQNYLVGTPVYAQNRAASVFQYHHL